MWKRLWWFLLTLILLSVGLSGCWDAREVNSFSIILAMGIDPVGDDYEITIQNPLTEPTSTQNGTMTSSAKFNVTSSQGRTIFEAARNLTTHLSRENFWPHTSIVVLNEQLSPKGLLHAIDFFARDSQRRRQVYFVLTDHKAQTILNTVPQIESYTSAVIEQLIENSAATGFGVTYPLNMFLNHLQSLSGTTLFNFITLQHKETALGPTTIVDLRGTGVIYQDRLMGELSNTETRAVNILQNSVQTGLLVLDLEGNGLHDITLEITQLITKLFPKKMADSYLMQAEVLIKCNIVEYTGIEDMQNLSLPEIESKLALNLEKELQQVFKKATEEIRADFLLFGNRFMKIDHTLKNISSEEWRQIFLTSVQFETTVHVEINTTGIVQNHLHWERSI